MKWDVVKQSVSNEFKCRCGSVHASLSTPLASEVLLQERNRNRNTAILDIVHGLEQDMIEPNEDILLEGLSGLK